MKRYLKQFKRLWSLIKDYFENDQENIGKYNLMTISLISLLGIVATGLLLSVTPLIIKTWHISIGHILLFPFFISFLIISSILIKKENISTALICHLTLVFFIGLLSLVIYLNIVPYRSGSATLVAIVMIVLPAIFILPLWRLWILLIISFVISVELVLLYNDATLAGNNIFNLLVGCLFGSLMGFLTTKLRANDFQTRQELIKYSSQDSLTGILNKSAVQKRCFNYFENRTGSCALLIIDVDDFKQVNDTKGHFTGDEVLSLVGNSLQKAFCQSDIIGRIGGDEFIVVVKNIDSKEAVERSLNRYCQILKHALVTELGLEVTCSFGGIVLEQQDYDYLNVFKMADKLLYQAKQSGKNNFYLLTVDEYQQLNLEKHFMLIVDDEEVNRELLRMMFQDEYEIVMATDGQEALEILECHEAMFSIILLDIIMPRMNGYAVISALQKNEKLRNIPIVVISSDEKSELELLQLGVGDMITKPFDQMVTKQRVHNVLARWHR